jgi:two-component system phosphate regulon sensor histidine kinase PhoR
MGFEHLTKLAALIEKERDPLLARWREQTRELPSAKRLDTPTLTDHIPAFLDELAEAFLRASDATIPESLLELTPPAHGRQRFVDGFDIVEVVAEYNILRGCVHDLAERNGIGLCGKAFHILNRVLDGAIGLAVQTFATRQALEVQHRREEYLAFVAHDLRTPLNAISLSARVIELKVAATGTDAGTGKMLKSLQRNVRQLEFLVDKILKENAHIQTEVGIKLERRELDLWALVEALIHDLHPVAGTASTTLTNAVPEGLIAFADASLLKRIFQNLIANAIKYTPRGEVIIGAAKGPANGSAECWVSDDGAGIASERIDKVFDKLETDHAEGGLGLGLAIVKTFVEAHGGQVAVESVEGNGSTFRFNLPGNEDRR